MNSVYDITNPVLRPTVGTGNGVTIMQLFLQNFIDIAFGIGGVIFFFMLIWGGYEYITAGGDKDAISRATKRITTAFIGIVILLSVYAILYVIEALFGISLTNINIPVIK
jgi:hypothetical protein